MTPATTLITYGSAVKALGGGRVGGYLVLFGSPEETDASDMRDFFAADTDFGLDTTDRTPVWYHHTLDKTIGNRKIGAGTMKMDAAGVWLEAQLELRDEYEKKIYAMAEAGKLGLSSGTADHLVRRQSQPNGSHKIVAWPLGVDASLTPTPAEPRTRVMALKSLAEAGNPDTAAAAKLMAEGGDESAGAVADSGVKCAPGMAVKWAGYGSMKKGHGKVVSVHSEGNVPGTENHVEATKDFPAARVHVREKLPEGGYRDTGRHQAHPVDRLKPDTNEAAKGVQLGDTDEPMAIAALCRLNDIFLNCFYRYLASDAYTSADIATGLAAAFDEYKESALRVVAALLPGESPGDDLMDEAKALTKTFRDGLHAGLTLNDHSDSVLAAVKGLSDRLERLAALNAAEGRKLSRPRVEAIKSLSDSLAGLLDRAEAHAKGPSAPPSEILELRKHLFRLDARHGGYA